MTVHKNQRSEIAEKSRVPFHALLIPAISLDDETDQLIRNHSSFIRPASYHIRVRGNGQAGLR
jgi:hypothetical protein